MMMTITESIGLCFGAGVTGWCLGAGFYMFRRFAYQVAS